MEEFVMEKIIEQVIADADTIKDIFNDALLGIDAGLSINDAISQAINMNIYSKFK
jgi:ABC-type proline/glycine betaine transport system substrate-binding protein